MLRSELDDASSAGRIQGYLGGRNLRSWMIDSRERE